MPSGLFDSSYRESLSSAREEFVSGPKPPGAFSGIFGAIGRAFPAAYNETMSAITGIATDYGRAAAYTHGAPAAESLNLIGDPAPIAEGYRAAAKALTPDPITTGVASRFVFDATKLLTKAATLGIAGGLPVAVAGTSGIEGTVEAQRLKDEGIDATTAAEVGLVRALGTGASLALPVAGKTALSTLGLVAAGGPVSFMAEQTAAKKILEHADYHEKALTYDPFDPAGLALSVAVPGAIGAAVHAVRGVRARRLAISEEQEAAARAVQLQGHIDETRLTAPDNLAGAQAHVDALETARAQLDTGARVEVAEHVAPEDLMPSMRATQERIAGEVERAATPAPREEIALSRESTFREGTPAGDMDAPAAIERARQIVGDAKYRELVDRQTAEARGFFELIHGRPMTPEEVAREAEHVARQVIEQRGKVALQPELAALLQDPDIRAGLIAMRSEAGWIERGGHLIRDPATGEAAGRTQWIAGAEWWPGRPDGLSERSVRRAVDKALAGDKLTAAEARTVQYMADYERARLGVEGYHPLPEELEAAGLKDADTFDAAMVARASEIAPDRVERLAIEHEADDAAFMRGVKEIIDGSSTEAPRGGESGARPEGARESGAGTSGASKTRDAVEEAAGKVAQDAPNLKVIDDAGVETTAADLLARAEAEYMADVRDADGYLAAVSCFVRSGA